MISAIRSAAATRNAIATAVGIPGTERRASHGSMRNVQPM